tara:strand:+ start:1453 stop:1758 length:306 start_codon:yes stop_codon:yes gene_type:complete
VPETQKKGGVHIPEWIWKALQSSLLAAVVGGYGMFYSMHSTQTELKLKVEALQTDVIKLETDLQAQDDDRGEIRESLAAIKAELPFIKRGIEDLGSLLRKR